MPAKHLGLLIAPLSDTDRGIMRGVVKYVQDSGGWEIDTREAVPSLPWEALRRWKGDGLIAAVYHKEQYQALRRKRMPVVNACARVDTEDLPTVFSDNREIGRRAASHLLQMGLTQFAFVERKDLYHDRQRGEGFRQQLGERGFACADINVADNMARPNDRLDRRRIAREIRRLDYPVGIFAAHDNLGCEVLRACRELNVSVPYQVAVLGVNNYELLCDTAQPPLTSICQQARRIGYEAARLLDRLVKGESTGIEHVRLPPGELIERRSTEFLAIDDPDVVQAVSFIRANASEPITVDDVLEHLAVSRRTLDKRFIIALGHPPAQEIRLTRIRRAQHLLTNTTEPILTVALQSGFRSVSGFDRAFREKTGLTPRQYRRQFRALRVDHDVCLG